MTGRAVAGSTGEVAGAPAKLYTDDADLDDIAFDWDISGEVRWLLDRLGPQCRRVLEPGCGSGRMLDALASRGLETVGIDSSPTMVALARQRLAGRADVLLADMADFDLGRTFEGDVCPINTLCLLTRAQLTRHLEAMARHLEPGSRYLVQVGLADPERRAPLASSHWEASRGDTHLRIDWVEEELDVVEGWSRQRSRIHVLSGPRAGDIVEELHDMTAWTPSVWRSAIGRSSFTVIATYDGGEEARPRVEATAIGALLWHALRRDV